MSGGISPATQEPEEDCALPPARSYPEYVSNKTFGWLYTAQCRLEQATDAMARESGRVLKERWEGIKKGTATVWEATGITSETEAASQARLRIKQGVKDTFIGLGTLIGPDPLKVYRAAVHSAVTGDADHYERARAEYEAGRAAQDAAYKAIFDALRQSWDEAKERGGYPAAIAGMGTTIGVEVVGGKGLGALGRVASVLRRAKNSAEVVRLLDKEIAAARAAGASAEEIKILEDMRRQYLHRMHQEGLGDGVAVTRRPSGYAPKGTKLRDLTASEANKGFGKPPYKNGTIVEEYKLTSDEKFVRLYDGKNTKQIGRWLMPESEIRGLTAEQIMNKFSLPQLPTMITEVTVPAGTIIRIGEAGPIPGWGIGGGIQVQLTGDFIPIGSYSNARGFP